MTYYRRNGRQFNELDCQIAVENTKSELDEAFEEALKEENYNNWTCVYECLAKLAARLGRAKARMASYAGKAVMKNEQ